MKNNPGLPPCPMPHFPSEVDGCLASAQISRGEETELFVWSLILALPGEKAMGWEIRYLGPIFHFYK